jgi:hypothetical protein
MKQKMFRGLSSESAPETFSLLTNTALPAFLGAVLAILAILAGMAGVGSCTGR